MAHHFSEKCTETHYVHSKLISLFMCIRWPHPQGERASWTLNAQTRAAMNENTERSRVSNIWYCTKSKKEVSGDLFVSSCHIYLPTQRVHAMSDCAGIWLSSSCHITVGTYSVQSRFLCKGMILLSICNGHHHPGQLFWLISHITVLRNMVGFVVDGHI